MCKEKIRKNVFYPPSHFHFLYDNNDGGDKS